MIETLSQIWVREMRYRWSSLRHRNSPKSIDDHLYETIKGYIPSTVEDISGVSKEVHNRFVYTNDGVDRLYDSIDTPASCLGRAFINPPLRDDCDGFHSALYGLVNYNFRCSLLTVVTEDIKSSHTMLFILDDGVDRFFYVDYTYVSGMFTIAKDLMDDIKDRRYRSVGVMYHELSFWDGRSWVSDDLI